MVSKKDEFLEKMQSQLEELTDRWNIERKKLDSQAQHFSAEAKKKLDEQLNDFRKLRHEMKTKLLDLDMAGENAWEEVKEGSEEAWKALKASFKKALDHFK